jgi:hypothetical protein
MASTTEHIGRHYPCEPDARLPDDALSDAIGIVHRQVSEAQQNIQVIMADNLIDSPLTTLRTLANDFLAVAGYLSLADFGDDSAWIRAYTDSAANALVARLQSARQQAGRVSITVIMDGDEYRIPATGGEAQPLPSSDFLSAQWNSIITRNPRLLTFLLGGAGRSGYPITVTGDYESLWALAWQQIHTGDAAAHDTLRAAQIAAETARDEYATAIAAPAIHALRHAVADEAVEFNATLADALRKYRTFWGTTERHLSPVGFVAWHLLALACFAADRGLPITVTSGYLPAALLDRAWTLPFSDDIVCYPNRTHDDDGNPLPPIRLGVDGLWELLPQ